MNAAPKPASLFRDLAFVVYPVKDVKTARAFYEERLGLTVTTQWQNDWVEYDIGGGTLAITLADDRHQPGRHGPSIAVEVGDLKALLRSLQASGIPIHDGPWDSPACLGCIIRDPDGNELILHQRK